MPAALIELLIISNPDDAAVLKNNDARQAMARGVARAILDFLESDDRTRPTNAGEAVRLS
jgi:N-acetylmuramoyl-L-alanine amidase